MNSAEILILSREELCGVFGSLRRAERVKQRIFQLNRLGEKFGIKLSFSSVDGTMAVRVSSAASARELTERLVGAKGHIQRAMGELLVRKFQSLSDPRPFLDAFVRCQVSACVGFEEGPWWEIFGSAPGAPQVPRALRTAGSAARGAARAASSDQRPGRRKCRELGSAPGAPQAAGVS
ncbi:MAG: hypothetical protein AAB091_02160, partial [Elusimicrobiota bacterium]